jgi:hypothetical protein
MHAVEVFEDVVSGPVDVDLEKNTVVVGSAAARAKKPLATVIQKLGRRSAVELRDHRVSGAVSIDLEKRTSGGPIQCISDEGEACAGAFAVGAACKPFHDGEPSAVRVHLVDHALPIDSSAGDAVEGVILQHDAGGRVDSIRWISPK